KALDAGTGRVAKIQEGLRPMTALAFSPDGRMLALLLEGSELQLWPWPLTGQQPARAARLPQPARKIAFTSASAFVLVHEDGEASNWTISAEGLVSERLGALGGRGIRCLAAVPGRPGAFVTLGAQLAVWTPGKAGTLQPRFLDAPANPTALAVAPDGRRLFT